MSNAIPEILARHAAFWAGTEVDRPLVWTTPHEQWTGHGPYRTRDGSPLGEGMQVQPGMLDLAAALRCSAVQRVPPPALKAEMANAEQRLARREPVAILDGDFVASWEPHPFPWMEAIMGCPVFHSGGNFWTAPLVDRATAAGDPRRRLDSPWFAELVDVLSWLVTIADDRIPLAAPLFRGPFDMAAAAIGAADLCAQAMDDPAEVERLMDYCTELYVIVSREYLARTPRFLDGSFVEADWGLWAPGEAVRFQCDSSHLISPAMYREQFMSFDRRVARTFAYPALATHTSQAQHLRVYADIPELRAIEVYFEVPPFGRPPLEMAPHLQSIQAAGKSLLITGAMRRAELHSLLALLSPRGLAIRLSILPEGM
jgi:hypothetical protein